MNKKKNDSGKIAMTLGVLGMISGICLVLMGKMYLGIFGFSASAMVIYRGYKDFKRQKANK